MRVLQIAPRATAGRGRAITAVVVVLGASVLVTGCGGALRPFADRPIVWHDDDTVPFASRPEPRASDAAWDAADGLLFRAVVDVVAVESPREAVDVNALDEVPSSSFFENRIGLRAMSPEEVARGACGDAADDPAPRPWRVVDVKIDGVQRGFVISDAHGQRHLVKTDGPERERSTAADVIVAALLHAAGYFVPCNRIVRFAPDELVIDDDARAEALRLEVDAALGSADRDHDGRVRASISRYLPGTPLGPWTYAGRWERDPNDRVPHELRREVRALRWFSAWVDHVDARAHNTLAIWIAEDDARGHVRHALLDFGDCLGATSPLPRRSARYGQAHWLDVGLAVEDVVTLGLLARPWYRQRGPLDPVIGDFAGEPFDPDRWQPNYRNGAFEHGDLHDAAWAARIIARFTPAHLRALVALGRFSDPSTAPLLERALLERRDVILERHLTRISPLTSPRVEGGALCLEDVAVAAGIRAPHERDGSARAYRLEGASARAIASELPIERRGATVCAPLPDADGYLVVDVRTGTHGRDRPWPARVHLRVDDQGARVIGLERPTSHHEPTR